LSCDAVCESEFPGERLMGMTAGEVHPLTVLSKVFMISLREVFMHREILVHGND
jgi:hypothetical protein